MAIRRVLQGQPRLHNFKPISDFITQMQNKKAAMLQAMYQDRGKKDLQHVYSEDQALKMATLGILNHSPTPFKQDVVRQAIQFHLDQVGADKNCGRSELMRGCQLPDVRTFLPEAILGLSD